MPVTGFNISLGALPETGRSRETDTKRHTVGFPSQGFRLDKVPHECKGRRIDTEECNAERESEERERHRGPFKPQEVRMGSLSASTQTESEITPQEVGAENLIVNHHSHVLRNRGKKGPSYSIARVI